MSQKYSETAENHEEEMEEDEAGNACLGERLHFGEWLDPMHKFSGSETKSFTIADQADTVAQHLWNYIIPGSRQMTRDT